MFVPLISLLLLAWGYDATCSCTHLNCYEPICCEHAYQTCLSGQSVTEDLSYDFKLPADLPSKELTNEERRAVAYAGIQRLVNGSPVYQKWYAPLWQEANGTVWTSPFIEVKELYRTAAGQYGALIYSENMHTLILNGESVLYQRCEPSTANDCFPFVLEPAVHTLTRIKPAAVLLAYTSSARQAATMLATKLAHTLGSSKIMTDELTSNLPNTSCVLLCGTKTVSKPYTTQKALKPAAISEYRYLPMPGATERITWLTSVASVVLIGTWNGSYKFSMA